MSGNPGSVKSIARSIKLRAAVVLLSVLLSACQTDAGGAVPGSTPTVTQAAQPAPVLPRSTYRPAGEATLPSARCAAAQGIPAYDSFAMQACREREAGYSERLRTIWARVSDDDVRYCEANRILVPYDPRPYSARAMYICLRGRLGT